MSKRCTAFLLSVILLAFPFCVSASPADLFRDYMSNSYLCIEDVLAWAAQDYYPDVGQYITSYDFTYETEFLRCEVLELLYDASRCFIHFCFTSDTDQLLPYDCLSPDAPYYSPESAYEDPTTLLKLASWMTESYMMSNVYDALDESGRELHAIAKVSFCFENYHPDPVEITFELGLIRMVHGERIDLPSHTFTITVTPAPPMDEAVVFDRELVYPEYNLILPPYRIYTTRLGLYDTRHGTTVIDPSVDSDYCWDIWDPKAGVLYDMYAYPASRTTDRTLPDKLRLTIYKVKSLVPFEIEKIMLEKTLIKKDGVYSIEE